MGRGALVAVAVCACLFCFAGVRSEELQPDVPGKPIPIRGSKKTVMFPHRPHEGVECVVCHHKVDGKPDFRKCADAGCHDNLKDKKGEKSLYFVIHSKSDGLAHASCLQCHTRIAEEKPDLKKALTGCKKSKCHG